MALARVVIVLSLVFLYKPCESQLPSKRTYRPITEDLPHVRCDSCQKGVRAAYKLVAGLRDRSKKVSEEDILEKVEKLCNPREEVGYWMRRLDIQEVDGRVKLVEQAEKKGSCRRECQTVSKACEETISEVDTDLAELLYRGKLTLSQAINTVCHELTDACTKKPPPYKGRKSDEPFEEVSDQDLEMEKLMSKMSGVPGMPGMEMYSRDDLEQLKEELGDTGVAKDGSPPKEQESWYNGLWQRLTDGFSWLTNLFYNPSSDSGSDDL